VNYIPVQLAALDKNIHNIFERLKMDKYLNYFLLFAVFFIVPFLGIFVDLQYNPDGTIRDYTVKNLTYLFANPHLDYPVLSSFFISLLIGILFISLAWVAIVTLNSMSIISSQMLKLLNTYGSTILTAFTLVMFLSIYYTTRDSMGQNDNSISKNILFFILCFVFTIVATPISYSVVMLLYKAFPVFDFFFKREDESIVDYFARAYKEKKQEQSVIDILKDVLTNTKTKYNMSISVILLLFVSLWMIPYSVGHSSGWISDKYNSKSIQMFVALLISMIIGTFFALTPWFSMFSGLSNFLFGDVIKFIVMVLGPITILGLAITQLRIANISIQSM
jgi:hypothetical protein